MASRVERDRATVFLAAGRIAAGVAAGVLGGYVARYVLAATTTLGGSATEIVFWAVVFGGFYKGYASAKKLLISRTEHPREPGAR